MGRASAGGWCPSRCDSVVGQVGYDSGQDSRSKDRGGGSGIYSGQGPVDVSGRRGLHRVLGISAIEVTDRLRRKSFHTVTEDGRMPTARTGPVCPLCDERLAQDTAGFDRRYYNESTGPAGGAGASLGHLKIP